MKKSNKINTSIEKKNAPNAFLVNDKLKKKIESLHYQIIEHQTKGFEKAVELGEILNKVKLSLPHGHFQDWIEKNFNYMKIRTVQYYMKFYHNQDRLRSEMGKNLSILDAKKFLNKSKDKDTKHIPKSAVTAIDEHIEKEKAAEKNLKKFLSGKLDQLSYDDLQIVLPKREQNYTKKLESIQKTLKRLERLEKTKEKIEIEIEKLRSVFEKNAPDAFLNSENPDSIE